VSLAVTCRIALIELALEENLYDVVIDEIEKILSVNKRQGYQEIVVNSLLALAGILIEFGDTREILCRKILESIDGHPELNHLQHKTIENLILDLLTPGKDPVENPEDCVRMVQALSEIAAQFLAILNR